MNRLGRRLAPFAFLLLAAPAAALAQDAGKTPDVTIESVRKNPDDDKVLNAFFSGRFRAIASKMRSDAAAAEKGITDLKAELETIKPEKAEAKTLITRARAAIGFYEQQIELSRLKLSDLEAKLKTNPDDTDALVKYSRKAMEEISGMVYGDADAAAKKIESTKAFLADVKAKGKAESGKAVERTLTTLDSLEKQISTQLARGKLVGKKAAPLEVEAWVNGSPLTDADLKGKVVLLDFWAVWCGPCVATFPHLREWNAKYADKGLVMIGMTRYYNYEWDEKGGKAVRSQGKVSPEDEQAMLVKFAEANKLTHRFGVQKGNAMTEYYGVTGIPQAVVIDREGVVRMVKVGSGDENAKAIGDLLEKLVGSASGE